MLMKSLFLLIWVAFIHFAGIYLFTRGFLLSRLSLTDHTHCLDRSCTIPATHKRALILIIDALRFDFIAPEPPSPASPFHHNVLTLPRELTAAYPDKSFLFNAFSDPPTTTLQRIKGLTTGSLPTFVDMGSNFGGSSIDEDSIIKQLSLAGRKIAFMGDDTWTTVFPDSFQPNMSFPYDSFNVEDLHTVDEGVIQHLFPLLEDSHSWDFMIGHFLGVDHAGHRVGPDHPTMKAKLEQMNEVLTRVVDHLDEDTLLVVLGDHGMDRRGDHGGDGDLETSCGVWVYSKGPVLADSPPPYLLESGRFPGISAAHRSIQQIDLVPSLSMLLGLPIPFNNLGTLIPELFWRNSLFSHAMNINAAQIKKYLDTYRSSSSGGELDSVWPDLQEKWEFANTQSHEKRLAGLNEYTRLALASCRSLWAQFNVSLMGFGLALLFAGVVAPWALYSWLGRVQDDWEDSLNGLFTACLRGMAVGSVVGVIAYLGLAKVLDSVDALDWVIFDAPLMSCITVIIYTRPSFRSLSSISVPITLILHTLAFFSNSFTVWEDHIVLFLLISSLAPSVLTGFKAPTARLRYRILGFTALFAVCVRLMAVSTVCREEQHPYCHVTFFASSSLPSPPTLVLVLLAPTSLALPWICRRFLAVSKSDKGLASLFLPWILPPTLLAGNAFWILEWADSSEIIGAGWSPLLRGVRTMLARCAVGGGFVGGLSLWWLIPTCLEVKTGGGVSDDSANGQKKTQVTILGFANAYGSPYFIFWTVFLGLLFVVTQSTGQVVLSLATISLLAYLEVIDSVRDAKGLAAAFASAKPSTVLDLERLSAPLQFSDISPLVLLAIHTFHTTGHQSTIPSIQWKAAFVLTSTLTYPVSPALVVLNTFGPQFLLALAAPLLVLWNLAPLPHPSAGKAAMNGSIRTALAVMACFATLLGGSAVSAAWLRRHLMVWKIFAPRFMSAAAQLVVVDLALLIGVGVGVARIVQRITEVFQGMT